VLCVICIMYSVREFRKSLGLTQRQLAKRWGMSQPAISRLEKGHSAMLPKDAIRISKKTGIPLEALIVPQTERRVGAA
jgi:transcriptional regulator with XRE-family HTH domain